MPTAHLEGETAKLAEINKQILEIKKKIQLSEGQRKALFEECEAEKKANAEVIARLKKEVSELVLKLHESKSITAKLKTQKKKIKLFIGPIEDKKPDEVQELLDLQIIDRNKQIDLIRYRIKRRQKYLAELAKEYQLLLSEKAKKQVAEKVDIPVRKTTCELQNSIHAVEVQLRESIHISKKYTDIKRSLQEDAARFESKIKVLDEKLNSQKEDITKLQQVLNEATRMRSIARGILLHEEKVVQSYGNARDRQSAEGKRLVTDKKHELEELEKKLFQVGKPSVRPEPEGAEDDIQLTDNEKSETLQQPIDILTDAFESLKKSTGGTNADEVLERFVAQKDTYVRLMSLRKNAEEEKNKLEKQLEKLNSILEHYKYAEAKDAEKKSEDVETLRKQTDEENNRFEKLEEAKKSKEAAITAILDGLQKLFNYVNPLAVLENDPLIILKKLNATLVDVLKQVENIQEEKEDTTEELEVTNEEILDEKWLPTPYNSIVRRTPVPQAGSPAAPPIIGSDEEDEVPSRGYLKRQAQIVVDAKSRKKAIRIPGK